MYIHIYVYVYFCISIYRLINKASSRLSLRPPSPEDLHGSSTLPARPGGRVPKTRNLKPQTS